MKLELLEIGQADQLSACKLALLLGVFTPKSQVEGFLKFARGILHSDSAILAFQNEPYVWYSSPEGFKAFQAKKEANLAFYFDGELAIGVNHPNYQKFSEHIRYLGVEHKRVIAFNLLMDDQVSIGQIILFDDHTEAFVEENLSLVQEFAMSLIRIIELRVDYSELKELYEQQLALNFSKTKFFQVIAHDLRAPFHGLLGFSEVLAEEHKTLSDREVQDIAEYLNDTAQSTYSLLESLLNWAMAEGGRFVYHPMSFQLKQVSKIVYDVLNTLAVKKNIQLIENVPEDLKVYADINMITSVVQNIVSNALKFTYTDGTGKVTIQAKVGKNGVEISIQDTGLGMTPQQIEGLFRPNLKVSIKGTFGEKGAGLGLVLCKRFVDINYGQISVESEQGKGTTFTVILPSEAKVHPIIVENESSQQDQTINQIEKIS